MTSEKVVLITGASSGFGYSLAQALAQKGYIVFGTSRNPSASTPSTGVTMLSLDVRSDDSVKDCIQAVSSRTNRVDILVNNAGYVLEGPLEEVSIEQLKAQFETNFFGAVRMVNAILPMMRRQRSGHIINVSSVAGLLPLPFLGPYCASKFALEGYSESLRHELKPLGIHVSLVEPSFYKTKLASNKERTTGQLADYDPHRQRMIASITRIEENSPDPKVVVDTIAQIVESKSPRLRHVLGQLRLSCVMRGFMPEPMWESGIRRYWKIDK